MSWYFKYNLLDAFKPHQRFQLNFLFVCFPLTLQAAFVYRRGFSSRRANSLFRLLTVKCVRQEQALKDFLDTCHHEDEKSQRLCCAAGRTGERRGGKVV